MRDFLRAFGARLRANEADDVMVDMTVLAFRSFGAPAASAGLLIIAGDAAGAYVHHDRIVACLTLALAATALSIALLVWRFRQLPVRKMTIPVARRWQFRFAGLAIAFCAALAAANLRYFIIRDQTGEYLSTLAIFGIFAVLSGRQGFLPWIGRFCGWIMFGAMALAFLISGIANAPLMSAFVLMVAYTFLQAERQKFATVMEQLRGRRHLSTLAETDMLTGLPNRRKFHEALVNACARADEFTVLMIDLDRFKPVNDSYGHAAGDRLLQLVADRLQRLCRAEDLVARIGGDEFAILRIGGHGAALAAAAAAKIMEALELPFNVGGKTIRVGASVGASTSAADGRNPETLLARADADMYNVKSAGAVDPRPDDQTKAGGL